MEEVNAAKIKSVIIFSGGQDSTTCLLHAINSGDEVHALTFYYGQKNKVELGCAANICKYLGVPQTQLNVSELFKSVASTPYLDEDGLLGSRSDVDASLPSTWVPDRNMLFITLAHAFAVKIGFNKIVTGVNCVDYSGYPDCRPEFLSSLETTLQLSVPAKNVIIEAPLLSKTKSDIWALADKYGGLDIIKNMTHTCYNGDHTHLHEWGYGCGECDACKIRKSSYEEYKHNAVRNPSV